MGEGIGSVVTALASFGFDRGVKDDDLIDRLNHLCMYGILIALAVGSGAKQYTGTPIYCWTPPEYNEKQHKRYVNNYCWVHSLYSIPFDNTVPLQEDDRWYNDVSYYRWATVIFVVLAVLFRVPHMLWKELKQVSGANLEQIISMTQDSLMIEEDKRTEQLGHVAEFIHRWIITRSMAYRRHCLSRLGQRMSSFICFGKRSGHNLVLTYLLVKLLYLANVIGQFFIISRFIKADYWSYGMEATLSYIEEGEWDNSHVFPRIALCDFKIRQQSNVNTFTVQCVLSINLFLEKMFLFLWFCLLLMLIVNTLSLASWSYHLLSQAKTTEFLMKYSGMIFPEDSASSQEKKEFREMTKRYLKPDGVFLIKLISINTTDIVAVDLLKQIIIRYKKIRDWRRKTDSDVMANGIIGNNIGSDD